MYYRLTRATLQPGTYDQARKLWSLLEANLVK